LLYALTFYSLSPSDEEMLDITPQDRAVIRQVRKDVGHFNCAYFEKGQGT
jgi:hypothetical protein